MSTSIFLFLDNPYCAQTSYLSIFVSYIKSQKMPGPYSFSYVGESANLLPNLTLNENIFMDFSPNSLTNDKENQFHEFLTLKQNIHIKSLYDHLQEKNILASLAHDEMKKLTTLIKVLINAGQYIFLDKADKDLSDKMRILFKDALNIHLKSKQISTLIYTENKTFWLPQITHIVSRNKDFQFHTESIILESTKKKIAA